MRLFPCPTLGGPDILLHSTAHSSWKILVCLASWRRSLLTGQCQLLWLGSSTQWEVLAGGHCSLKLWGIAQCLSYKARVKRSCGSNEFIFTVRRPHSPCPCLKPHLWKQKLQWPIADFMCVGIRGTIGSAVAQGLSSSSCVLAVSMCECCDLLLMISSCAPEFIATKVIFTHAHWNFLKEIFSENYSFFLFHLKFIFLVTISPEQIQSHCYILK